MSGGPNDKQNRSYGAEDIRRYLAGEMPAPEMHALEAASLEDPLLGDALEGMREHRSDPRADLELLRRRLAERTAEKKPTIPLWLFPLKIAAGILLLLGLGGLGFYFVNRSAPSSTIAESKERPKPPVAAQPAAPAADSGFDAAGRHAGDKSLEAETSRDNTAPAAAPGSMASARANKPETTTPIPAQARRTERPENHRPPITLSKSATQNEAGEKDDLSGATTASPSRAKKEIPVDSGQISLASSPPSADTRLAGSPAAVRDQLQGTVSGVRVVREAKPAGESLVFSGQVNDEKGEALPGVQVALRKKTTITDMNGKFTLSAAPEDSNFIAFSSVGYNTVTLIPDLIHRDNIAVTLSPASAALNEVVVAGYSSKRKSGTHSAAPVPVPGWKKYRSYLGANKLQPAIDSSLHGTEKLTFTITRNGEPADFTIDQSLSPEHDSLAIRIIRNGPKWKPAKDSSRKISLALPYWWPGDGCGC